MNSDEKMTLFCIGGVLLFIMVLIGGISASTYSMNQQTLKCQELNQTRTAAEVQTLCGELRH